MTTKYTKISEWRAARVHNGMLYVRQTNGCELGLEQGGYAGRVYRMHYDGTLTDAQTVNDNGISDIDRCVEYGTIIRQGRLIQ